MDNAKRATYGAAAIEVGTPDFEQNDLTTDAADTIANVLHHLAQQGLDPDGARGVVETALMHFHAEQDECEARPLPTRRASMAPEQYDAICDVIDSVKTDDRPRDTNEYADAIEAIVSKP